MFVADLMRADRQVQAAPFSSYDHIGLCVDAEVSVPDFRVEDFL